MKKIILPLGLITFVTVLLLSVNISLKKDVQNEIFMSAIALAQGENDPPFTGFPCYSSFNNCGWWGQLLGLCDLFRRCGDGCTVAEGEDLRDESLCLWKEYPHWP